MWFKYWVLSLDEARIKYERWSISNFVDFWSGNFMYRESSGDQLILCVLGKDIIEGKLATRARLYSNWDYFYTTGGYSRRRVDHLIINWVDVFEWEQSISMNDYEKMWKTPGQIKYITETYDKSRELVEKWLFINGKNVIKDKKVKDINLLGWKKNSFAYSNCKDESDQQLWTIVIEWKELLKNQVHRVNYEEKTWNIRYRTVNEHLQLMKRYKKSVIPDNEWSLIKDDGINISLQWKKYNKKLLFR